MSDTKNQLRLLFEDTYQQVISNLKVDDPELSEFMTNSAMLLVIKSLANEDRARLYQLLANDDLPGAKELINKCMPNFSDQLKKQVYIMLEQRND